jgi:putative pyruvate formate lyase activating enzyme
MDRNRRTSSPDQPAYLAALRSGALDDKIVSATSRLKQCSLCPRLCGVDRTAGERGRCNTGNDAVVCSYHPHFGEEAPLVGSHGSGTIFFTHCSLACTFCQNYEISHLGEGHPIADAQLATIMLELQENGCHNINFVTPTHVVPQLLSAIKIAAKNGLEIPLVYNTGAYDNLETLQLLDGIIDIYMPDFKFWSAALAAEACDAPDYPEIARGAVTEMHRQVGDLVVDKAGLARRGVILRHLVLPAKLAGTREIMAFVAQRVSEETYVNIMPQYRPCGRARKTKGLGRSITAAEYREAMEDAKAAGIKRFDRRRRVFASW